MRWALKHARDGRKGGPLQEEMRAFYLRSPDRFLILLEKKEEHRRSRMEVKAQASPEARDEGVERVMHLLAEEWAAVRMALEGKGND